MTRQKVTISLEPELVQKIDEDRGLIPRSRYIEKLLKEYLASTQNTPPQSTDQTHPGQTTPPRSKPLQANPSHAYPDQTRPTQTKR